MNRVEIANFAISRLGGRAISSLEQGTENAILMNQLFDDSVREVLEIYSWPDLIKRATLGAVTGGADYTRWEYCYQTPDDFVWLIDILSPDGYEPIRNRPVVDAPSPTRKPVWEREQNHILTDVSPCRVTYIHYPTDMNILPIQLAKTIGLNLAHNAAQRLGRSEETQTMIFQEYAAKLTLAMSSSGNDGRGEPHETMSWGDFR